MGTSKGLEGIYLLTKTALFVWASSIFIVRRCPRGIGAVGSYIGSDEKQGSCQGKGMISFEESTQVCTGADDPRLLCSIFLLTWKSVQTRCPS